MHTCPPPVGALEDWLEKHSCINGNYGHLLLEQKRGSSPPTDSLRPYFESAHLDARKHFHRQIGMDLHPDAGDDGFNARYPNCLPPTARRGLFGEVLAGLVTESYEFVGRHRWLIPVFLFRYHADAEKCLFDLARNTANTRAVFGRFGTDFLGISVGEDGTVVRFIAGEAKWRKRLNNSTIEGLLLGDWKEDVDGNRVRSGEGIWQNLNDDTPLPHSLRQLQRLLEEVDPDTYSVVILSLDKALLLGNPDPIPRTDLVLIAGNDVPRRERGCSLIQQKSPPPEYTAGNDLQVVEVILDGGEELIDAIYDSLWAKGD